MPEPLDSIAVNIYSQPVTGRQNWDRAWAQREPGATLASAFLSRLEEVLGERAVSLCIVDRLFARKPKGLFHALEARFAVRIISTSLLYSDDDLSLNTSSTIVLCPRDLLTNTIRAKYSRAFHGEPSIALTRDDPSFDWSTLPSTQRIVLCAFGSQTATHVDMPGRIAFLCKLAAYVPEMCFVISFSGTLSQNSLSSLKTQSNIVLRAGFPQLALLQRSLAFITHAGLGSVKEAIFMGVPMLCWPLEHDQWFNAECVEYHGLGLSIENMSPIVAIVARQLDKLSLNDNFHCRLQHFQQSFQDQEKDPVVASHLLEATTIRISP